MDPYLATEIAFRNGVEEGKKIVYKHGRWRVLSDGRVYCSECGTDAIEFSGEYRLTKHCPECGVILDGVEYGN